MSWLVLRKYQREERQERNLIQAWGDILSGCTSMKSIGAYVALAHWDKSWDKRQVRSGTSEMLHKRNLLQSTFWITHIHSILPLYLPPIPIMIWDLQYCDNLMPSSLFQWGDTGHRVHFKVVASYSLWRSRGKKESWNRLSSQLLQLVLRTYFVDFIYLFYHVFFISLINYQNFADLNCLSDGITQTSSQKCPGSVFFVLMSYGCCDWLLVDGNGNMRHTLRSRCADPCTLV